MRDNVRLCPVVGFSLPTSIFDWILSWVVMANLNERGVSPLEFGAHTDIEQD